LKPEDLNTTAAKEAFGTKGMTSVQAKMKVIETYLNNQ